MRMRVASVAAAMLMTTYLGGCGDNGGNDNHAVTPPPPPSATVIDLGSVALTASNQSQTFDVLVTGTSSLTIVADGGDATDIDIERLRSPSGVELITPARGDANPLTGGISPQEKGQSVATAIVPSTLGGTLETGTYTFSVASFDAVGTRAPADVHLTAIVNHRDPATHGSLPVRVFVVDAPGVDTTTGSGSGPFFAVFDVLRNAFRRIDVDVELVDTVQVRGDAATRLAVLDVLDDTTDRLVPDRNLNRQSDEMDELFALSGGHHDRVLNVFFVREFVTSSGVIAVSGGAPGPSLVAGTAHSGVVVSTLGGLDRQSATDLENIGVELTAAVARYLGVPGTVDPDAFTAEQELNIRRNPLVTTPAEPAD